jgi:hypothetical protein
MNDECNPPERPSEPERRGSGPVDVRPGGQHEAAKLALNAGLASIERSELPGDLKRRVMGAARLPGADIQWRDRVWYSRGWRVAAAAALLAIVALDLLAPIRPVEDRNSEAVRLDDADRRAIVRDVEEIGLPADAVKRLLDRVEFVPLTAREPRDRSVRTSEYALR